MGISRNTGGSATELSATDAWAKAAAGGILTTREKSLGSGVLRTNNLGEAQSMLTRRYGRRDVCDGTTPSATRRHTTAPGHVPRLSQVR